jgi:hypothetical protein
VDKVKVKKDNVAMSKQSNTRLVKNLPLIATAVFLLALVLIWLAPAEKSLGQAVKLVFLHAALMWVAFGLVTLQGLLSLVSLLSPQKTALTRFNTTTLTAALILFLATGLLGMYTAVVTWGGVNWTEPRLFMLAEVLVLGLTSLSLRSLLNAKLSNIVGFCFAAAVWFLVLRTELVMHPANPIFSSNSLTFKTIPVSASLLIAAATLALIFYLWQEE